MSVEETAKAVQEEAVGWGDVLLEPWITDFWGSLESAATVIALVIGGVWAYLLLIRKRVLQPRLEIDLSPRSTGGPQGCQILQISVVPRNLGDVVVKPRSLKLWVQQVSPIPAEILDTLADRDPNDQQGPDEIAWPRIGTKDTRFKDGEFEIEPSESDELIYDFVLSDEVEEVQIYVYIENARKQKDIGWNRTVRFRLPSGIVDEVASDQDHTKQDGTFMEGSEPRSRPNEKKVRVPPKTKQRPPKDAPPVKK